MRLEHSLLSLGSSPLARGLPRRIRSSSSLWWIIPARAGFTPCAGVRAPPRAGSSPLARGLHQRLRVGVDDVGIIPARAGFTGSSRTRLSLRTDHPRSRGVYVPSAVDTGSTSGSSPLARGLLSPTGFGVGWPRIIPARAGFTGPQGNPLCRPTDHPRSRGVYLSHARRPSASSGSSPLARGLHACISNV